jgi:polyisoprenyl-teichoic acid--peptidoglycan teichoic acid transferase
VSDRGQQRNPPGRRAARVGRVSQGGRGGQRRHARPPARRARVPRSRARFHRAETLAGTLGLTALGTFIPGSGILLAGRRGLGLALLAVTGVLAGLVLYAVTHKSAVLAAAVDPDKLLVASLGSLTIVLGTIGIGVLTYLMVRRRRAPERERAVEIAFVVLLCLVVAAPFAVGARFAFVQRDLVNSVFAQRGAPVETGEHVWGSDDRVNVLLLGGDGGVHRIGIRTDTVILASMDADTGDTVLFSLPRNLQRLPFPAGSELDRLYPHGFTDPSGDPLESMLNAVYGKVPALYPHLFRDAENPGAKALEQGVSAALGMPVDHYVLINLKGFQQMVDAIGGVTVNINEPIPIGGNTDKGIPPRDYLQPGPSQHLDGFEALWFARGRYGLDDYNRMARQRCVVDAFIDETDPMTLLRRYESLASAGKEIVRTDIPQELVPSFAELALNLRNGDVHSVVFRLTDAFNPNDPDYGWMHRKVERTLAKAFAPDEPRPGPGPTHGAGPRPRASAGATPPAPDASATAAPERPAHDPCAYHPVG